MSKYINSISYAAKENKRNEFQLYFGGRLVDVGNALDVVLSENKQAITPSFLSA